MILFELTFWTLQRCPWISFLPTALQALRLRLRLRLQDPGYLVKVHSHLIAPYPVQNRGTNLFPTWLEHFQEQSASYTKTSLSTQPTIVALLSTDRAGTFQLDVWHIQHAKKNLWWTQTRPQWVRASYLKVGDQKLPFLLEWYHKCYFISQRLLDCFLKHGNILMIHDFASACCPYLRSPKS